MLRKVQATVGDYEVFNSLTIEQRRAAAWVMFDQGVDYFKEPRELSDILQLIEADLPLPSP